MRRLWLATCTWNSWQISGLVVMVGVAAIPALKSPGNGGANRDPTIMLQLCLFGVGALIWPCGTSSAWWQHFKADRMRARYHRKS